MLSLVQYPVGKGVGEVGVQEGMGVGFGSKPVNRLLFSLVSDTRFVVSIVTVIS